MIMIYWRNINERNDDNDDAYDMSNNVRICSNGNMVYVHDKIIWMHEICNAIIMNNVLMIFENENNMMMCVCNDNV